MTNGLRGRRYLRFLALAVTIIVVLLAIGVQPTRRLAGEAGVPAMLVGCLISLAGASLAAWVVVATTPTSPNARMQTAFLAMTVRLVAVAALAVAAILGGSVARTPLLFWLATSYIALLPIEVKLAIES